ncbi:hypothetical protein Q5P01_002945 [Channa striata]|uniref:Uncharacterized protein n=1 Tax=Channa striata TaxID=64152 RepID=A0AA88NRD3_CHASR|nr:hypothetical protein Q5P01_002945 [Channa striata]
MNDGNGGRAETRDEPKCVRPEDDAQQTVQGKDLFRGLGSCGGFVLVLCDLCQQDRSSVAAGEENQCPPARLTTHWTTGTAETDGPFEPWWGSTLLKTLRLSHTLVETRQTDLQNPSEVD